MFLGGKSLFCVVVLQICWGLFLKSWSLGCGAVIYRTFFSEDEKNEEEFPEEPKEVVESPQPKEESSEDYYRKYMPHGYDRGGSYDKKE